MMNRQNFIIGGLLVINIMLVGATIYLYNQIEETSNAVFYFKTILIGGAGAALHGLKKAKEDDTIVASELKSIFYATIIGFLSGMMIALTTEPTSNVLLLSGLTGFGADSIVNGVVKIKNK